MSQPLIRAHFERFLEENELDAVVLEDSDTLRTGVQGEFGDWICDLELLSFDEDMQVVGVLSYLEWSAPQERHDAALRLINRINSQGLVVGNFEMDEEDGQLRLRSSISFGPSDQISYEMLSTMIFLNWTILEEHIPLLTQVLLDGDDLEEAWTSWSQQEDEDEDEDDGEDG